MIKSKSDSYSYCYCRCFNLPIRFLVKIWKAKQARKPALHFAIINIFRSFIQFSWTFLSIEMIRGHKLRMCFDQTDECDILINWINTVCCFSIQINHPQRPAMAIDRLIPPNDASLWRNKNNLNSDAECCFAAGQPGPDDTKLQQNQVQIDSKRRQQVVTEQKMARFMWFLWRNKRCCLYSKWSLILIPNPQVVKEIVTDIMIIISSYFLLDNILRNILVSRKVSLEAELPHATLLAWLTCRRCWSKASLFSSIAVRISKSPTFYSVIRRKTWLFIWREIKFCLSVTGGAWLWSKRGSVMEFTFYRDCV